MSEQMPDHRTAETPLPFEPLLAPIARRRLDRLMDRVESEGAPGSASAFAALGRELQERLARIAGRVLFEDFASFRDRESSAPVRSDGTPGRALFERWIRAMHAGRWARLLGDCPELARLLELAADDWEDACAELAVRLARDRALLAATFGGVADAGDVVHVAPGLSDPHGRGRTVCIVRFASGLEVVYKPRPVGVERSFTALVAWLDGRGLDPALRAAGALERGRYGWAERILPAPCPDEAAARLFYRRAGALVCLMDLLGAVDLHYGNLVACAADPVPVDLETLFHPGSPGDSSGVDEEAAGSVLRTGLLPLWIAAEDDRSYDVSGLGAVSPRMTTIPRVAWRAVDTDAMALDVEPTPIPRLDNAPTLAGRELAPADYESEIISGFASAYRLVSSRSSELLSAAGPLVDMRARRTRVLFRHTVTYRRWLEESLAPECLRSGALRRTRMQTNLDRSAGGDSAREAWLRSAELEALLRLDVPHLSTRPGAVFLEEAGGERIDDWFERPRFDRVVGRLARLDEADLERRTQLLEATFDLSRLERLMRRS